MRPLDPGSFCLSGNPSDPRTSISLRTRREKKLPDSYISECTAFSGDPILRSMTNHTMFILDPPYSVARRIEAEEPALGAVALLDAVVSRPTTNDVKNQMDVAPWCPLCLLAGMDSGMRSTRRLPRTCVVFDLAEQDGADAILKAVAARPRPTPSDLVDWLVKRTHLPSLSRMLSDLFAGPSLTKKDASFLSYAIKEQLRMLGEWDAADWQRAARLADLASDRSLLNRVVSGDDANAVEMRRWIHELLGLSERQFHERYGWEWVLEAALRRSGFPGESARGRRELTLSSHSDAASKRWSPPRQQSFGRERVPA